MKLEVNGVRYSNFKEASAELRLDALSNTFSFTAVSTGGAPLPFRGGEECRVLVNNELILTGFIEVVEGSYDARAHEITVRGRDKTGDIVDSTLAGFPDLGEKITLKSIIQKVLANIGSNVSVVDNANPASFNAAEDIAAIEPGDNAFELIEKLARKRQVILTSDANGDIVIAKTPGETLSTTLQNITGADNNNVLRASYSYDLTGRFNVYRMSSTLNPVAVKGATALKDIVHQSGNAVDTGVRTGRQFVIVSESANSNAQNLTRAQWEARVRQARGQVYSAVVQGFTMPGTTELWALNTVVGVYDDFAGIRAEMLVNSITYTYGNNGSFATLGLVEQNAYNLQLQEPQAQELGF